MTFILFQYNGLECGIDPISISRFDMWCGCEFCIAECIDDVMDMRIFEGKSLNQISKKIKNLEF